MTTDRALGTGPIHLNFRSIKQVVVEPEDENRFMMTAKELREQFSQVLLSLKEWSEGRSSRVVASYVYPGDGFLNVLICTRGGDYDFDFDDEVTDLDISLTKQFGWLTAEVMQAPESARDGHTSLENNGPISG